MAFSASACKRKVIGCKWLETFSIYLNMNEINNSLQQARKYAPIFVLVHYLF